jgi:hypothetical protein
MQSLSGRFLEFVPAGDEVWHLCDRSLSEDHPQAVVATVKRTLRGVTVVWHRDLRAPRHFSRLDDVFRTAIEVLSCGSGGPTRPIPIPHRPPVHARRAAG